MIRFVVDVDTSTQRVHRVQMEQPPAPPFSERAVRAVAAMEQRAGVEFAVALTRSVSSAIGKHVIDAIEAEKAAIEARAREPKRLAPLAWPLYMRCYESLHDARFADIVAHTAEDAASVLSHERRLVIVFARDHAATADQLRRWDLAPMARVLITDDPAVGLRVTCIPARPPPWSPRPLLCEESLDASARADRRTARGGARTEEQAADARTEGREN
jgi:hypothetical protein